MKHVLRALLTLSIAMLVCSAAYAGVSVSLQPVATHTVPDRLLNICVYVDSAGSPFNAYETVIRWNPQILQFASVQQDTLFGDSFQWWAPEVGPDSVLISHAIMQGGVTVTGPGALSSITFRALQIGETAVSFQYIEFYRYGFDVTPVWSHDAIVYVENPNSGAFDAPAHGRFQQTILVSPNPIENGSILSWSRTTGSGAVVRLYNADGRLLQVKRMEGSAASCRLVSVVDLRSLSTGPYFVEILANDVRLQGRFINLGE